MECFTKNLTANQTANKLALNYLTVKTKFELFREMIANFLEEIRVEVNSQVSSFSRVHKFVEQIEPFIKTPTKKIKRYLYVD